MGKYFRTAVAFFLVIGLPIGSYLYLRSGALKIHIVLPKYYAMDVDADTKDTIYHTIPDFKFIAQNGETITQENFKDKIYIADFFFTSCKGICMKMSSNLTKVQDVLPKYGDVPIISHSVNPVADSVSVLKNYAEQYGAKDGKWYLVTGDKKEIYSIAREGYKLPVGEGDGGENDFIHSERFVLVDKQKIIRGYYDGTDSSEVKRMMEDVQVLLREYKMKKTKKNELVRRKGE